MRAALALALAATLACGRAQTVVRGATSIFRSSAEAPRHDDPALRADARLTVQWVGHATMLIQLGDRMIATDPLVTSTAGVLSKRLVKPGVTAEQFPQLDLAVLSHVHFDHLSYGSLEELSPKISLLAIPEGGFPYLPEFSFDAREAAAWTTIEHAGIRATAVPAAHGGWRYGVDASWAHAAVGWVLERDGLSVYFAGDTGYDAAQFAAIRKRWPHLDLALLPIAPMEPHSLIGAWHMDPAEAVRAFRELGARVMIPIHFDTFINSLDAPGDATVVLARELKQQNVPAERVRVLAMGERSVLVPR
jgi:L-ascorbate metabolism protein UlaG (beta-lactamase superfamily)